MGLNLYNAARTETLRVSKFHDIRTPNKIQGNSKSSNSNL
ncbi:hypothetical protein V6Z12_A12G097700 [Gossypium hirsutum]